MHGVATELSCGWDVGRHDRTPAGLSFDDRDSRAFVQGGENGRRRRAVGRRELLAWQSGQQRDVLGEPECRAAFGDWRPVPPGIAAKDQWPRLINTLAIRPVGPQQTLVVLVR